MKALVLTRYNHFEMQDVPVPAVGPEDVLVRVQACGICGSDVHGMDGSTGRRVPPVVMGHEAAGVVSRRGSDVRDWAEGDRVTFDSTIYCGRCFFCRRGRINLCQRRRVLGVSCDEYRQDGAMAEFVAVPQRVLYRLPEGLSFHRAALVEPLSVAVHAVGQRGPAPDETVAVIGAGMIGLLVIQVLRAAGCRRIIAVDLDDDRLVLAGRFGAAWRWRADAVDVVAAVADLTEGRGADAAFEVVGITPTLAMAVASLRRGGELVLVGNLSPQVDLPLQAVVTRELSLRGSCASSGEYPECLDMIARGAVDVDPLISAVAPLAEGPRWFDRLRSCESGLLKVVLEPGAGG